MGRWAALTMASALMSCQAFLLPLPLGGGRSSVKSAVVGGGSRPVASQPVARDRLPSLRSPTASRTLKTRVCAGPLEGFSTSEDYDRFLGELIFSQSDVRDDVLKNLDKAGKDEFIVWLEKRIEDCADLDERVGLKSLLDIIKQVKSFVDKALEEEEAEKAAAEATEAAGGAVDAEIVGESGERRSNAQVWEEMRRLQRLGVEATDDGGGMDGALEALKEAQMNPFEGLPQKVRAGYEDLLTKLLDRAEGETLDEAVETNYDQVDIQFLTLLNQKATEAAGTDAAAALTQLGNSINNAMERRMSKASEPTTKLQAILGSGNPDRMVETISAMAERGEVDDALVLLLQANLQQAEEANAGPAVDVLKRLGQAAQSVLDEKVDPEKKLVRQLLRAKDRDTRIAILNKAFRQRAKVVIADGTAEGTETSDAPDVTPPRFIEAVKGIIRNFGNVGESELGFAQQLDDMISEAEQVATELYGETQSPQDMQDRAWKDTTVSVFDLENMEEDGKLKGEEMPWANDQYDGMTPEMVKNFKTDSDGNLQIGGS
ncbi:unnamed protein product [Pylaiella littoralis]